MLRKGLTQFVRTPARFLGAVSHQSLSRHIFFTEHIWGRGIWATSRRISRHDIKQEGDDSATRRLTSPTRPWTRGHLADVPRPLLSLCIVWTLALLLQAATTGGVAAASVPVPCAAEERGLNFDACSSQWAICAVIACGAGGNEASLVGERKARGRGGCFCACLPAAGMSVSFVAVAAILDCEDVAGVATIARHRLVDGYGGRFVQRPGATAPGLLRRRSGRR